MQFDSSDLNLESLMTGADTEMESGTATQSKRFKPNNPPIIFSKDGKANKTKQDTMKFKL